MSADIINLRRTRKERKRGEKEKAVAQNRARFGMTRAERERITRQEAHASRHLDGHNLRGKHENSTGDAGDSGCPEA